MVERATNGKHRSGIVLVLDDEDTVLSALERKLRLAGLHPLTTKTIRGAWEILDSWVVHVVVADERLGEGEASGASFLADVGRNFPGVGRVLLTAFLEPYLEDLATEGGFVALDKSVRFGEFLAVVKRELGADG